MGQLIYEKESYEIVGICMEIYNVLGTGFDEIVYKDALEIELKARNIPYIRERGYEVTYKGKTLNRKFYVDFYVFDKIDLEIKAQSCLVQANYLQTRNYCACSKSKLGILINFGGASLEYKRVLGPTN